MSFSSLPVTSLLPVEGNLDLVPVSLHSLLNDLEEANEGVGRKKKVTLRSLLLLLRCWLRLGKVSAAGPWHSLDGGPGCCVADLCQKNVRVCALTQLLTFSPRVYLTQQSGYGRCMNARALVFRKA